MYIDELRDQTVKVSKELNISEEETMVYTLLITLNSMVNKLDNIHTDLKNILNMRKNI